MAVKIKIQMDPAQKILAKRNLEKGGAVQRFFTHEMRRKMDPYVPFLNGPLKNTAVGHQDSVEYVTPYAKRQYFENKGKGLRGKEWDKRCWADQGDSILDSVAKYAGGKVKK